MTYRVISCASGTRWEGTCRIPTAGRALAVWRQALTDYQGTLGAKVTGVVRQPGAVVTTLSGPYGPLLLVLERDPS